MSGSSLARTFDGTVGATQRPAKRRHPPPVSVRFTEDERARLHREAGNLSLSVYIRERLFGETAAPRKPHDRRKQRRPSVDSRTLARLLGMLGQSDLATSMMALAMAARSGALPVTPELSGKLDAACDDIREMRLALIVALRIRPEDGG